MLASLYPEPGNFAGSELSSQGSIDVKPIVAAGAIQATVTRHQQLGFRLSIEGVKSVAWNWVSFISRDRRCRTSRQQRHRYRRNQNPHVIPSLRYGETLSSTGGRHESPQLRGYFIIAEPCHRNAPSRRSITLLSAHASPNRTLPDQSAPKQATPQVAFATAMPTDTNRHYAVYSPYLAWPRRASPCPARAWLIQT
ncbi:hypothetical protein EMIT048CA2_140076 [Pseudomonas chlororaphis]